MIHVVFLLWCRELHYGGLEAPTAKATSVIKRLRQLESRVTRSKERLAEEQQVCTLVLVVVYFLSIISLLRYISTCTTITTKTGFVSSEKDLVFEKFKH